jgi:transcriptional repressor NrdR
MTVIKNNGTRETFDKTKLLGGIMKSCNKRPITVRQMEEIADDVENAVMSSMEKEIASKDIGTMVMDRLKVIDEIAYVRFASVYRQFKDINTFMNELAKMLSEKNESKSQD